MLSLLKVSLSTILVRLSRGKHEGFRNTFYGDPIDRLDKARDDSALSSDAKLC